MKKYDPVKAPKPEEWNELNDEQRLNLIKAYHKEAGIKNDNEGLHAGLHLIVESQIAMGDQIPIAREVRRLVFLEGANRHNVIHAVGEAFVRLKERAKAHPSIKPSPVSFFREVEALKGADLK